VKKFENQLLFGLEPIIGEPGGELATVSEAAKRILLSLSDILMGTEELGTEPLSTEGCCVGGWRDGEWGADK